jgi:hypothetical protein
MFGFPLPIAIGIFWSFSFGDAKEKRSEECSRYTLPPGQKLDHFEIQGAPFFGNLEAEFPEYYTVKY